MTTRLSYASSPESDGEFCGEDTPRRVAQVRNATARQENGDNRLVRSNSDPSLARQDGTIKSDPGDIMPDFSSPPPYSIQPDQTPIEETKRRSHGGDSKYGLPTNTRQGSQGTIQENVEGTNLTPEINGGKGQSGTYNGPGLRGQSEDLYGTVAQGTQQNAEQEDLASASKQSQSQPSGSIQNKSKKNEAGSNGSIPILPPKIDRQKKPQQKSAAERLFGRGTKGDKHAEKNTNRELTNNTDISENSPVDPRQGGYTSLPGGTPSTLRNAYNSNSSRNYDSYNKNNEPGYSYSRSTSQPVHSSISPRNASTQGQVYSGPSSGKYSLSTQAPPLPSNGQDRYRYSDYNPLPPPKSSVYKPLPPLKPKPFNRSASQPPSISESNYMNGNYLNSAPESDYPHSFHYHSSKVTGIDNGYSTTNGYPPSSPNGYTTTQPRIPNGHSQPNIHPGPPNGHTGPLNGHDGHNGGHPGLPNGDGNGYDKRDSNGVDSGQGSSLDRDYSSYNGQCQSQYNGRDSRYGPLPNGSPPSGPPRSQQGQFYYNLPTPREGQVVGQNVGGGSSSRRRAPGDTLDLSNCEYRGSAFELYKKPGYQLSYQDVQI